MVIGVTNVGKSMYCRMLTNALLNKYKKIAFLDMDVGQGEFSTEGVLSINLVDTPQFRTSTVPFIDNNALFLFFSFFMNSRVFYGDKTPESNPIVFKEAIRYLIHYYLTNLSGMYGFFS